ncbi:MAG: peptidoglycan DD-metalloendopeptidase family protein [Candidatus Pacebacteria bacterium]|nr:peptidoglycan DD-metalloendopeptidase family protein [Candidatus Paceibacterota bacterium]
MRHLVCFIKPTKKTVSKIKSFFALSLLFGVLFVPIWSVKADLFSSLSSIFVGDQAYALQANVSSVSILEEENSKDGSNNDTINGIDPNTDNISDDKALSPNVGSGVSDDQNALDSSCGEPNVYVVAEGDTIAKIADLLDVSEKTVLAANDMKKTLTRDDVLFIPSVSGVEHTVTKGQTLQQIAKLYKVDAKDIIYCNGITPDSTLALGDELTIPGGDVSLGDNNKSVKSSTSTTKKKQTYQAYPAQNLAGFINPAPGYRLSQGRHDGNAVDLAIATGTPIHAAAAGRVIFARTGYNGGFGNLVIISHPNGTQTLYAHQSKIATHSGDQVSQGEVIGYVGSTGHSTGPHIHFEVKGAFNPGINNSWAK